MKDVGSAISMASLLALAFFIVKLFPVLSDVLGMHGNMFDGRSHFRQDCETGDKMKSFDGIMKLFERGIEVQMYRIRISQSFKFPPKLLI